MGALGAATLALPLPARAQGIARVRRIGVFTNFPEDDLEMRARLAAFAQGLRTLGWIDGRNLAIDYRWGAGSAGGEDRLRRYAAELVALSPDVLLAAGGVPLSALLQITRSVPIVFTQVADPVGAGFVANLARPGGNATGFTNIEIGISGKWLELLREIAPRVARAMRPARSPWTPSGSPTGT